MFVCFKSRINLNYINLANYCLILYAFLLPINAKLAFKLLYPIIIFILLNGDIKERILFVIRDKLIQAFILMLSIYIIWLTKTDYFDNGIFQVEKLSKLIFSFFVITLCIKDNFIYKILQSFLLAMFISEIFSYAMYFQIGASWLNRLVGIRDDNIPFMMNYTQHTTSMSLALGILLYFLFSNTKLTNIQKIFYSIFTLTSTLNIFILGSRIGYILFLTSVLIVLSLLFVKNIKKFLLYSTVIITLGYSFAYSTIPIFKDRVDLALRDIKQLQHNDLTTSGGVRYGFIMHSLAMIVQHPFFGYGTGAHPYILRNSILQNETNENNVREMLSNIPDSFGSHSHNQFIDLLLQFGIVGILFFLNIFYQIFKAQPIYRYLIPIQYLLIINLLIASFSNPLFIFGDVEKIFVFLCVFLIQPFREQLQNKKALSNEN